jgi:hypothetical protein
MAVLQAPTVLNSWKEIATYLGRGVRTVQRYEQNSQLPVRRLRGKTHGAVIAFPKDLDIWLRSASAREEGFPVPSSVREWYALQNHREAMGTLTSNLLSLSEQIAEGLRIRSRQHWFGENRSEKIEQWQPSR